MTQWIQWAGPSAVVISAVVRVLKSDTRIPLDVPPRVRVWLALGLGLLSTVLDRMVAGASWPEAVSEGIGSAILAIAGHDVIVGSLRGGKEFAVPGLTIPGVPPGPGKPPSLPPPGPDDPDQTIPPSIPRPPAVPTGA